MSTKHGNESAGTIEPAAKKAKSASTSSEGGNGVSSPGWTTLLKETKVGEICHRGLVTVEESEPLSRLLHLLLHHNILSCPVLSSDPATHHEFLGFVDTLDIAGYVLATWKKHSRDLEHGKFPASEFFETPVSRLLDFSHVDPSVVVTEDTSLLDAIDIFSDPHMHLRLHRLAVVDTKKKRVVGIISQSDVVGFAYRHTDSFPPEMASTTLQDMSIGRSLIFVRLDSPFIDTLETLYRNRIGGLALLNEQFQIAGNVSVSDLRGISPSSFQYFLGSTLQFLVKGRKGEVKASTTVPPSTTLPSLLKIFIEQKVHRVYISDDNDRPHSVLTLGDVIARLL